MQFKSYNVDLNVFSNIFSWMSRMIGMNIFFLQFQFYFLHSDWDIDLINWKEMQDVQILLAGIYVIFM